MCSSRFRLIGIIIVALLFVAGRSEKLPAAEGLGRAMESAGVTVSEVRVSGWSRLPGVDPSAQQLVAITEAALTGLGISPGQSKIEFLEYRQGQAARAELADGNRLLTVDTRTIRPGKAGAPGQVFLTITVKVSGERAAADGWDKVVAATLRQAGGSPQITTCLVGWLDGKLEKDEWQERLTAAGRALGAAGFDTLMQPDFVSATSFSPLLPTWVAVGDKPVNLNLAIRFSPYDGRTYVTAGSPVILGE
ncbi:MAG: YwmB family TATA-box binding protein [Negativicutes bacterium]|nr:YwmB family TATA-box binding protein [Negativicutes bacterium]